MNDTSARLPCRGCMSNCMNYSICDGRLWRLDVKNDDLNKSITDKSGGAEKGKKEAQ
jgi:hypothetical protein